MSKKPAEHFPQLLVIRGKPALGFGFARMHPLPSDAPAWVLREIAREAATSDTGYALLGIQLTFGPDRALHFNGKGEESISSRPGRGTACAATWDGKPEFSEGKNNNGT